LCGTAGPGDRREASAEVAYAAVGVGLALLGAWYGYSGGSSHKIHPIFDKVTAVTGVISVGVLAEYYYIVS
jgi:hypothetical protein